METKSKSKGSFTKKLNNLGKNLVKFFKSLKLNKKVVGVVLVLLLLFIIIKIVSPKQINYPAVIEDANGDLFVITTKIKKEEDAIKIASKSNANLIRYANTTDRYVLFQKEANLYLYDARKKAETKKITNNISASNYYFTEDDKYVVALDESNNLKIYNYKETKKVESGVSNIIAIKGDHILFEKDNTYYVRSVKPNKDDKEKVTSNTSYSVNFTEDGKFILYISDNNELHKYNVKKNKDTKLGNNVTNYYCDKESCKKYIYVEDHNGKTLYYNNGKKDIKMAEDIFSVLDYNVEEKQVVYSKANGNKFMLFYQKGTKEASKIDEGLDAVKVTRLLDKDIYYLTSDNKLKYAKISGSRISRRLTVSNEVFGTLYEYKKGFAYITNIDSDSYSGNLYLAKGGKAKKISENVGTSNIKVSKDGSRVYYIKDFGGAGELYYTKGGKGKLIDSKVHTYQYVKDNLLYIVKDFNSSKARGDLYRYTNKSVKIADNISGLANVPNTYVGK